MSRNEYFRKYLREWRKRHPKKAREYQKRYKERHRKKYLQGLRQTQSKRARYNREHYLKINGKYVKVNKGPRPEACQLCGKRMSRLEFHHWTDDDSIRGIWVCISPCHKICDGVDKGLDIAYKQIKKQLNLSGRVHL